MGRLTRSSAAAARTLPELVLKYVSGLQSIVVLGSTGSIGTSCLDVIRSHPDRLRLSGASAFRRADVLADQAREFRPDWVLLADSDQPDMRKNDFPSEIQYFRGTDRLHDLVTDPAVDTVVSAMVGAAGLQPTWASVDSGKKVALANKESLVVAGPLMTKRALETGAKLLPVDSEHSAIFQALQAGKKEDLRRIILTASGGPFREFSKQQLRQATPEMALKHPTWDMGQKITIDSATMMNKALEIIEARWLFDVPVEQISVVVHPQSIVHSFVEYRDGSVISQLSPPDMRLPIQYALTFPDRIDCPCPDTDWSQPMHLEFLPPDTDRFPALELGFEAARQGGTCGAVLNAANEVAVHRFLDHQISFDQITQMNRSVMDHHTFDNNPSLTDLLQADKWARTQASNWKL